jgi:hypothetical protein
MPNDCWCKVRIGADAQTITLLKDAEFKFEILMPQPVFEPNPDISGEDERWYTWRLENWGTKWDRYDYTVEHVGQGGIVVKFTTAWSPPTKFFKYLVEKYPDIWLKCDWSEEGGEAGVFLVYTNTDKKVDVNELTWNDWCMEEYHHRMTKAE